MPDVYDALVERVQPLLRAGDVAGCERLVLDQLAALPESPFHIAPGLNFRNSPLAVARDFDAFFARQSKRFPVGALYAEMNEFQTNTRYWYYQKFAYRGYGGRADEGWLSRWDGESGAEQLWGMYRLQRVYAGKAWKGRDVPHFEAGCVAGLLVKARFWRLVADAAALMRKVDVPILVSTHDSGLVLEVRPIAEPGAAPDRGGTTALRRSSSPRRHGR